MPPRKRTDNTAKVLAAAAAFLAAQGIEAPDVNKAVETAKDRDYRSDDSTLIFAHYPANFKPAICKNCNRPFGVNRKSVGYCGDPCRREDWVATTGIPWGSVSTHDVWNGEPPLVISPDQFEKLRAIAEWFSKNRTLLSNRVESPSKEVPELSFRPAGPRDLPDHPVDPQIAAQEIVGEVQKEMEESPEYDLPLPTTPVASPALSAFELTPEEASLFGFA
jgi:hypothetical protein